MVDEAHRLKNNDSKLNVREGRRKGSCVCACVLYGMCAIRVGLSRLVWSDLVSFHPIHSDLVSFDLIYSSTRSVVPLDAAMYPQKQAVTATSSKIALS